MKNQNVRFSLAPRMGKVETSTFHMPANFKFTCDAGNLIPFDYVDMLPGDVFKFSQSMLIRGQTPKFPTMDNAYADVWYFAVPWRLVWDGTKRFFKEQDSTSPIDPFVVSPSEEKFIPYIAVPSGGFAACSPADYLGIPTGVASGERVNALPFRAYRLVWNEHFRDENLQAPIVVQHGDTEPDASEATSLLKVAKLHDQFTTCLPRPQRGPSVVLPIGTTAPVIPVSGARHQSSYADLVFYSETDASGESVKNFVTATETGGKNYPVFVGDDVQSDTVGPAINGSNLEADLAAATGATISQVRTAFQMQRVYESLASGGSRYNEMIKTFFGVNVPDARIQRSELVAKYRIDLNTREVIQTSGQDSGGTPTGNTAGYLRAFDRRDGFAEYAATEHTILLMVMAIRTDMTYFQGLERKWSRRSFEDVYLPALAHISEVPVYKRELYFTGLSVDKEVFGYQEAWFDYRYRNSRLAGGFKRGGSNYLDAYHYAHRFSSSPTLSGTFIESSSAADVGKTLAVTLGNTGEQFLIDLYSDILATRPMPLYSVPGLVDHF